jgi:hypothetical protein
MLTLWIIACLFVAAVPAAMAASETTAPLSTGGTIVVNSYPAGAAIALNGVYRGNTPAEFDNISPGNYSVTVSLAGYNDVTIPLVLWDGSRREIMVQLEQRSSVTAPVATAVPARGYGSIAIDSNPGGASVTLDGNAAGQTPLGRAALILNAVPAGDHTIGIELAGYPSSTRTVRVIQNQVVQVNADFIAGSPTITGTMIITSDRQEPVPLSPMVAIAAVMLIGLAAMYRRS